jgi:nucleotide-binding universal stress UspA family protein
VSAATNRIVVGLDDSAPARHALAWAVREALRRHASVLVVTAWPDGARTARQGDHRRAVVGQLRLAAMQRAAIAAATDALVPGHHPVIGREIVLADPVVALVHAGQHADLLVLGSDEARGLTGTSVAGRIARWYAHRHGGSCPLVVVPGPAGAPAATAARHGAVASVLAT